MYRDLVGLLYFSDESRLDIQGTRQSVVAANMVSLYGIEKPCAH